MKINQEKIYSVNYYLILGIPIFLISGPFLADLSVVILSLLTVLYLRKDYVYFDTNFKKFIKFFLIFYLLINFSSFLTEEYLQYKSFKVSIPFIRYLIYIISIYLICYKRQNFIDILSQIIVLIIITFFLDSLIQKSFGFNLLGFEISKTGRVSSFFNDELIMGSFICKVFPIGIIYFINNKKENFLIAYFIISFVIIILSQERSSLVLFFLSSFLILICIKKFRKKLKYILLAFSIIILSIYSINKESLNRIYKVTYYQLILNKGNIPIYSYEHQAHFKTGINLFISKPLFGHGIKSFRILCSKKPYTVAHEIVKNSYLISKFDDQVVVSKDGLWPQWRKVTLKKNNLKFFYGPADIFYFKNGDHVKKGDLLVKYKIYNRDGCSTHPHNYLIQLLAETGIFSFLIFIFLFILNIYILVRTIVSKNFKGNRNNAILLSISVFICFFPLLPTGSIYNNWLLILNFYSLGLLFAQYRFK